MVTHGPLVAASTPVYSTGSADGPSGNVVSAFNESFIASFGVLAHSSARGGNVFTLLFDAPAVGLSAVLRSLRVVSWYPQMAKSGLPKWVTFGVLLPFQLSRWVRTYLSCVSSL